MRCKCLFCFQAEDGIRDIGVTGVQTCALPILPWLAVRPRAGASRATHAALPMRALVRSPTAVALAAYFGLQAMQAYVILSWTAQYLRDAGLDAATAGMLPGLKTEVSAPPITIVPPPSVRPRLHR